MRWLTKWWGIILHAETEEENELLQRLYDALPNEPDETYETGTCELLHDEDGTIGLLLER